MVDAREHAAGWRFSHRLENLHFRSLASPGCLIDGIAAVSGRRLPGVVDHASLGTGPYLVDRLSRRSDDCRRSSAAHSGAGIASCSREAANAAHRLVAIDPADIMTPAGDRPFYRFEFKYELRPDVAQLIDAEIKRFGMRPDGHARLSDGSYVVSSLYFDSFDFNNVLAESGAAIIAGNILAALAASLVIVRVCQRTHRGISYAQSFVMAMVMLGILAAMAMMIVSDSVVRALGVLGIFALIRFRTILKDTKDVAYLFFVLAVGVAIGTNNYVVGVIGTLMLSAIILITLQA